MRNSLQTIKAFLANKSIAVVGVSHNKDKFGNYIYSELKKAGYKVYAVNPGLDMVGGDRCYAGLGALPEKPDGVIMVVQPPATLPVLEDMAKLGIMSAWLQQGAESTEAEEKAKALGIQLVSGECIMMHMEPVTSIHKFHRVVRSIFGKMPK
ncbi:MAG: CoA-binding protein [Anaerolineaceae bacterium]